MPRTQESELVTVREAATYLNCSTDTIRRMIERGELPAWRYGPRIIRIDRSDVDRLRHPVTPAAAYARGRTALLGGAA